jgi:MFS family permease
LRSQNGFSESLEVLHIRDFRHFLASRFFATLATQMQGLVVSWQIYQLTKDPLALGLVGLVEAVVFILFSLFAGHFSDRREKRGIILAAQWILLACALALFGLSRMEIKVWAIYSVVALTGLARSFLWPASFSYSELTVPRAIYSRAAAWNSTGWEVGSIVGPALGGFIYAWRGPVAAYAVVGVLTVLGIAFAMKMGKRPPVIATPEQPATDLLSGVRFVLSHPIILSAISLDMFAVLFGGAVALLPIFADIFKVGPQGLGWLRAAPSLGAILMAIYQQYRPPFQQAGRALLTVVVLFGLATIAFGISTNFWLSMILLAMTGAVDNVSVVIRASIMQAYTPDHMRGRVSSVNGIFIGSSNEIGAFESGLAAKLMGTVPSVIFGGAMTLITVALVALKSPRLRRLGAIHKSERPTI